MTTETINRVEAGPELDLLIAKEVMKYLIIDVTPPCDHVNLPYVPHIAIFQNEPLNFAFHNPLNNEGKNYCWGNFNPSTNISDAWLVVEKLELTVGKLPGIPEWAVAKNERSGKLGDVWQLKTLAIAPTACLAVCRAAWKAVMG